MRYVVPILIGYHNTRPTRVTGNTIGRAMMKGHRK